MSTAPPNARTIAAVWPEIHVNNKNFCIFKVKPGGIYSYHCNLKVKVKFSRYRPKQALADPEG
jgi:hypothetical protein